MTASAYVPPVTASVAVAPLLFLVRDDQNALRTLGTFRDASGHVICQTLELPWRDNAVNISCVQAGTYTCRLLWSPKHGKTLYWITGIPGRADVEVHIGNEPKDTDGCVLCGLSREPDAVDNSTIAFGQFMAFLNNVPTFTLTIMDPVDLAVPPIIY